MSDELTPEQEAETLAREHAVPTAEDFCPAHPDEYGSHRGPCDCGRDQEVAAIAAVIRAYRERIADLVKTCDHKDSIIRGYRQILNIKEPHE